MQSADRDSIPPSESDALSSGQNAHMPFVGPRLILASYTRASTRIAMRFLVNLIESHLERVIERPRCGRVLARFATAPSILIQYTNTRNALNSKSSIRDISDEENGSSGCAAKPVVRKYRRIAARATRSTDLPLKDVCMCVRARARASRRRKDCATMRTRR